jgi:hypothetical protein
MLGFGLVPDQTAYIWPHYIVVYEIQCAKTSLSPNSRHLNIFLQFQVRVCNRKGTYVGGTICG